MEINNQNFGRQDRTNFEAVKRGMFIDNSNNKQDIASRKYSMENKYADSAGAYKKNEDMASLEAVQKNKFGRADDAASHIPLKSELYGEENHNDNNITLSDTGDVKAAEEEFTKREKNNISKKPIIRTKDFINKIGALIIISGVIFCIVAWWLYLKIKKNAKRIKNLFRKG